ncbi:hypothetical protein KR038_002883 [Drosophila bunnanda]|nr:hypothetical protein KR038_002883 [Drosophila bunnanda]
MAFVARRNSDGEVVDRQQVSGLDGSRPLPLSDMSDEELSDSVMGYTSRSYGAPTVRFMGLGEGDADAGDIEGELEEDNLEVDNLEVDNLEVDALSGDDSDDDSDSITNFCNQLDEEEANDAIHRLKFEEQLNVMKHLEKLEDRCDLDEDDMTDELTMLGKPDDSVATDTETVMNSDQDLQSLCSFGSCTPTLTQRDAVNSELDNLSAKTHFIEDDQDIISDMNFPMEDKQDDMSPTTSLQEDNLDSLSARTYNKPPSIPKRERRRDPDLDQLSSRTYDMSNCGGSLRGSLRSGGQHDNSSMSTCSWTDMYRGALEPSEGGRAIVPSLSLASSTSDTSTYYKSLGENKERHNQAAFENWKARKAVQKQKSLLAAKQEREKREAEAALRQQQAQARFQEWCRRKEEQQQQERKKPLNLRKSGSGNSSGSVSSSGSGSGSGSGSSSGSGPVSRPGAARKAASEATRMRLKEWQVIKTKQQQREREQKRRLEENKQKLEEERKQRSQGAWNNWMKQVDKRAKPVPLNQGFDTLRGTISNIYINPVQWVSNIEPKESGRSR